MLLFTILCFAFGQSGVVVAQSNYRVIAVDDGGSISGQVRIEDAVPVSSRLSVSKDEKICGVNKPSPRLRVGKSGGVANALVWIEDIAEGKGAQAGDRRLELDQTQCEYKPHIHLLPLGSSLDIVNSDPILHNVHTYDETRGNRTMFNIAQPVRGQRTTLKKTQFERAGMYLATCDAGHPWMSAYIVVTEHPYYTLTDAEGGFRLDKVPPGKYKLNLWHEGVSIVRTVMEGGKPKSYQYEASYEDEQSVVVPANGTVRVSFPFALRSSKSHDAAVNKH
jgi:plastocyanin